MGSALFRYLTVANTLHCRKVGLKSRLADDSLNFMSRDFSNRENSMLEFLLHFVNIIQIDHVQLKKGKN